MAMIDYGALLKKNGKIMNRDEFFMDMEEAVGWIDYQRIRYPDCDHILGKYSDCGNCPRANYIHYSHPELGEWDSFHSDCRDVVPTPSQHMCGNYFVYAGDSNFTIAFYKTHFAYIYEGKMKIVWPNRIGFRPKYRVGEVYIRTKALNKRKDAYYARFSYKGDVYEVVYGYGIDPNQSTWNRVKKDYCDKKTICFVDKFWEEK